MSRSTCVIMQGLNSIISAQYFAQTKVRVAVVVLKTLKNEMQIGK